MEESLRPPPARSQQAWRGASRLAGSHRRTRAHTHTRTRAHTRTAETLPPSRHLRCSPAGGHKARQCFLLLYYCSFWKILMATAWSKAFCTGLLASGLFPCNPSTSANRQTVETQRGVRSRGQTWPTPSPSAHPGAPFQAAPARRPESQQQTHLVLSPPRDKTNSTWVGFSPRLRHPKFNPPHGPAWGSRRGKEEARGGWLSFANDTGTTRKAVPQTGGRENCGRGPRDPCHPHCAPGQLRLGRLGFILQLAPPPRTGDSRSTGGDIPWAKGNFP